MFGRLSRRAGLSAIAGLSFSFFYSISPDVPDATNMPLLIIKIQKLLLVSLLVTVMLAVHSNTNVVKFADITSQNEKRKTNRSQSVSGNVQHHVKLVNCYVTHQVNAREQITCLLASMTMQQLDRQKQEFYTIQTNK